MDIRPDDFVAWDAVPGAETYTIELSQLSGTVDKTVTGHVSTSILFSDLISGVPGLTVGAQRRVRVRVVNPSQGALGNGDWSNFLTLTLLGPSAPQNLRVE